MWQLVTTICGSRYILAFSGSQVTTQTLCLAMVWREFLLLWEIPLQLMLTGKMLSSELIEVFPLAAIPLWFDGTNFPAMVIIFCVAWSIHHSEYCSIIVCLPSFREVFTMSACFLPFQIFFSVSSFYIPSCFHSGISRKVTSQRGFCKQCNSIVWLSNSKCSNECYGKISDDHQIMPVSLEQVCECRLLSAVRKKKISPSLGIFLFHYYYVFHHLKYLIASPTSFLNDIFCHCQIVGYVIEESIPCSDSDSDSDDSVDGSLFKLWAYPRRVSELHA